MDFNEIVRRHGDQRWGAYPYRHHLEQVTLLARRLSPHLEGVQEVAQAHDLLEDTDTRPEELPEDIRKNVVILSRNLSQGELSYQSYIQQLARTAPAVVLTVKLADALVNLALCRQDGHPLTERYETSARVLLEALRNHKLKDSDLDELLTLVELP